jgi:hypothetical protein
MVHLLVLSMGVSRCSSDYARLPSVARLTICIYIEIHKYCMPYYEVANHEIVTMMNMINEMPYAFGALRTTSLGIRHQVSHRAAPNSDLNPFQRMAPLGDNTTMIFYNRIQKVREETAQQRSEGNMEHDAAYWCRAQSNLPPGCLCQLWRSASTLTTPFHPDGNVFC